MNIELSKRLTYMQRLLSEGENSTQEDLRDSLEKAGFEVNQSTISRDLRRIGAIKVIDHDGQTTYKLSEHHQEPHLIGQSFINLIREIRDNGSMIVMSTTPGSASLIARQLDIINPKGILGTIAGDDTIFIAPAVTKDIKKTIKALKEALS